MNAQRKVTIQFGGECFSFTIEEALTCLLKYTEGVLVYGNNERKILSKSRKTDARILYICDAIGDDRNVEVTV